MLGDSVSCQSDTGAEMWGRHMAVWGRVCVCVSELSTFLEAHILRKLQVVQNDQCQACIHETGPRQKPRRV